jgi:hypothetical protein
MTADRRKLLPLSFLLLAAAVSAQTAPEITKWRINPGGVTGYNSLTANVTQVRYSSSNVYVSCTGIPDFSIGPWPGNPNTAGNQGYVFRIPRNPQPASGTHTATGLGVIAVLINGVPFYNALDGRSYNNQNTWHQNAVLVEAMSFDAVLGHPDQGSHYHHHQNPVGLQGLNSGSHSPLLGYAFDGYPIYGPYGFSATNGSGGIRRMRSSYKKRSITLRQTLPDGTVLASSKYGPAVSATYPLGYYAEDHVYQAGLGDLDEYNGRFAVTPEYPLGTYAYHVTVDATGGSEYPYVIGPTWYGVVATDNTSSQGHVTVSESVTTFVPSSGLGEAKESVAVTKASATTVKLAWDLSCSPNAVDSAVLEGTLGDFGSHTPVTCSVSGRALKHTLTPAAGDRYFLVLPVNATAEGSYGRNSEGTEIVAALAPCRISRSFGGCL